MLSSRSISLVGSQLRPPMANTPLIFLLSVLILPFFAASDDAQTLLSIKRAFNDPPSLVSWDTSRGSHCSWLGVRCAPSTHAVAALRLTSQDLHGELPATICDLANLTVLDLTENYISGGFPSVLYCCNQLRSLNLSENLLVGPIPDDIVRLTALRELNPSGNNFTGDIPRGIGHLASLEVLNLQNNLLNGSVPPEIGDLQNLAVLSLALNQFSGQIPSNIGSLKQLSNLNLSKNKLSGDIPASFTQLPFLNSLDLSDNNLSGAIPRGLGNLRISKLNLSNNDLTGKIPDVLDNAAFAQSFLHNPGLCASDAALIQTLRSCSAAGATAQTVPPAVLIAILAVVGIFALLSIGFAAALLWDCIPQRREVGDYSLWKLMMKQSSLLCLTILLLGSVLSVSS